MVLAEQFGIELPRYQSTEQTGDELADLISGVAHNYLKVTKPQIGDIVLLEIRGKPSHTGLYIGDGLMLHTLYGHNSAIERMARWDKRLEGFYRAN